VRLTVHQFFELLEGGGGRHRRINMLPGVEGLDGHRRVKVPLRENRDSVHIAGERFIERGKRAGDFQALGLLFAAFRNQLRERHFADKRMRPEEMEKTLGELACANDADTDGFHGMLVSFTKINRST